MAQAVRDSDVALPRTTQPETTFARNADWHGSCYGQGKGDADTATRRWLRERTTRVKPFRKILVPVDFSEQSERALQTAILLARSYEATVSIVHVYEPLAVAVPEGYVLFSETQLQRMFDEFLTALSKLQQSTRGAGVQQVDSKLLHGFAASEIQAFAEQGSYDLIVMGTHGRRGLSHALLGSVAERVLRTAPCPVLIVRAPAPSA
jgi:nucleotide-binding universal stress UspA family protein